MKIHWRLCCFPQRIKRGLKECIKECHLGMFTLCYNQFTSVNTAVETVMEPLFWIVDHFTKYLGPIMVTLVVMLTTMVVTIFYICVLPHIWYQTELFWVIVHVLFAHWLLINIIFNYVMAAFTDPGRLPERMPEVVSICKKCISPKPPRSHHCSVCNRCILKMDHHCPWLNNCVGFSNHRYFFLFCFYMWLGTVYVTCAGHDVFRQHFFGKKELDVPAFFFPLQMIQDKVWGRSDETSINKEEKGHEPLGSYSDMMIHNAVVFQFILCGGVSFALGLLTIWHIWLISRGETSIEAHINQRQKKRYKKKGLVYKNPYDFGFVGNWKRFFGLGKGKTFWRHVLLPSCHNPLGDGLSWETASVGKSYWCKNDLQHL